MSVAKKLSLNVFNILPGPGNVGTEEGISLKGFVMVT